MNYDITGDIYGLTYGSKRFNASFRGKSLGWFETLSEARCAIDAARDAAEVCPVCEDPACETKSIHCGH